MQLKPGDIVALTNGKFWVDGQVRRSRFIVLETEVLDLDGCFQDDEYIRLYCYDFEDESANIGEYLDLPSDMVVRIPGEYNGV